MLSFYPGPSRVYDEIPGYVKDAHHRGILSMNHRSPEFIELSKKTIFLLREKLDIPEDYTVFFTSSATECWEIMAQSLVREKSIHLFNGAFGEKWFDYTHRLHGGAVGLPFDPETAVEPEKMVFPDGEIICLTQNETSNGTQVNNSIIAAISKKNPGHLVAVDATSSMAGVRLRFSSADVWFASVQKCFGLPAGLAILVVSPKGMAVMHQIRENGHYNSLMLLAERMNQWQTPCTPNVLGIYLLMRTLNKRPRISHVHEKIKERAKDWYSCFGKTEAVKLLVNNAAVRSNTVIALQADPRIIERLRKKALKNGFLLGEGYGPRKHDTIRIANFPAMKEKEITQLRKFLTPYL